MVDVVIAGGGPAGASCAIWLHKLGVDVVLLEASGAIGGLQTRSPYENLWIPGVQGKTGQEVAAALAAHARDLGIRVELNTAVDRLAATGDGFEVFTAGRSLPARHVVLATGSRPRAGGFRPAANVAIGPGTPIEAIDLTGRRVAILGGGDNAFDQARFARDRGAEVTVFSRKAPRAQPALQRLIADIEVAAGPFAADQDAMTVNGRAFDVFAVMYGFEAVIPPGIAVETIDGYVRVDRFGETSHKGLYACGEITDYWHPCVTTACAHGIQVAKRLSLALQA